jgi:hypothetical protein
MKQNYMSRLSFGPGTGSSEPVQAAPVRPRNTMMDRVVKHAHTSERYSFDAVCAAVGEAVKKAKA